MTWPVLRSYDQDHLEKIALPLGGIGTGTVSLGGRGDLRDWEIVNRPAKGYTPEGQGVFPFLAVYVRTPNGDTHARLLEGPVEQGDYEGPMGSVARNHGFPRFRNCTFKTAYPFGQVCLSDPEMPIAATLKAFNPLVPGDADSSAYPAAIVRVALRNLTDQPLETAVCFSVPNFIGDDGVNQAEACDGAATGRAAGERPNVLKSTAALTGIHMTAPKLDKAAEAYGDLYLSTPVGRETTCRTAWADLSWGDTKLNFWDDFIADGRLDEQSSTARNPVASLCVNDALAPGETRDVTFLLTWRFPNRMTWSSFGEGGRVVIGNHYATRFADAVEAAEAFYGNLAGLEAKTLAFVNAFCSSSLPVTVLEAALFNISTLRSQTCFRTPDGRLYGWEGCGDHQGCCAGSCNHVWNYEHATAFLFGDLSRGMREVEFRHGTNDKGHMVFRIDLPLDRPPTALLGGGGAAADGQMGCIMKLYRDWQLSGDDAFLRDLYPRAKKALEFCWIEGGWDADRDGVMEGCQHNTMDVEYYGPNPQMGFWYLGALRAMQEMARAVDDTAFADQCQALLERGSRAMDEQLFNGEYYEHIVVPVADPSAIADGLRLTMGADDLKHPALQLGAGCLVDQLVGQYTAHILGLGHLSDPAKHRSALASIFKYNRKEGFHGHFNHMRSYVLGDESAVLMATYPRGNRPERPFPYFNEVMTGFEYTAAVHMLYEGLTKEGLQLVEDIRARYDGRKRNPFDEAECGHHYARAMAAWSAVLALTGFRYSGVTKSMTLKAQNGTFFWSNGYAWGTCAIEDRTLTVNVLHGTLELQAFRLTGVGEKHWRDVQRVEAGRCLRFDCVPPNEAEAAGRGA